jgi:hypothetical protein
MLYFFQARLDHFVPMLEKISNTCFSKTCGTIRLSQDKIAETLILGHLKYGCLASDLRYCSHMLTALIAGVVRKIPLHFITPLKMCHCE